VIRLVAGGDVNLQGRADPTALFDGLREVFDVADIRFVNFEGPLSGTPRDADEPTFRTGRTGPPRNHRRAFAGIPGEGAAEVEHRGTGFSRSSSRMSTLMCVRRPPRSGTSP